MIPDPLETAIQFDEETGDWCLGMVRTGRVISRHSDEDDAKTAQEAMKSPPLARTGPMDHDEALLAIGRIGTHAILLYRELGEFHDRKGWLPLGYKSFAACCADRFPFSTRTAYRGIGFAGLEMDILAIADLPESVTIGHDFGLTEGATRALGREAVIDVVGATVAALPADATPAEKIEALTAAIDELRATMPANVNPATGEVEAASVPPLADDRESGVDEAKADGAERIQQDPGDDAVAGAPIEGDAERGLTDDADANRSGPGDVESPSPSHPEAEGESQPATEPAASDPEASDGGAASAAIVDAPPSTSAAPATAEPESPRAPTPAATPAPRPKPTPLTAEQRAHRKMNGFAAILKVNPAEAAATVAPADRADERRVAAALRGWLEKYDAELAAPLLKEHAA